MDLNSDFAWMISTLLNQSGGDGQGTEAERGKKKKKKKRGWGGVRCPTAPLTVPHTCNCGVIYALSNIPRDNICCH